MRPESRSIRTPDSFKTILLQNLSRSDAKLENHEEQFKRLQEAFNNVVPIC